MGMADIAEVLWRDFLNTTRRIRPGLTVTASCCPTARLHADLQPAAPHRLRSADGRLKNFRQLHSKTPGHPEVGYTLAWKPLQVRWVRVLPTQSVCDCRKNAGGAV